MATTAKQYNYWAMRLTAPAIAAVTAYARAQNMAAEAFALDLIVQATKDMLPPSGKPLSALPPAQ